LPAAEEKKFKRDKRLHRLQFKSSQNLSRKLFLQALMEFHKNFKEALKCARATLQLMDLL